MVAPQRQLAPAVHARLGSDHVHHFWQSICKSRMFFSQFLSLLQAHTHTRIHTYTQNVFRSLDQQICCVLVALQLNDGLTYMDWTFPYTGLDFSYVWDPEMWIKFREAVKWNTPDVFWNKVWDRISYSK
eukprot:GHUV01046824.1.p1 GENE.GHUV01046824.1~~GHUV01046824.1.p1  ORF type:complete len:129 (-),score=8.63 GHUV01046824.1:211-597(-)